ncbi:MAG: hypothetical protein R6U21_06760 [Thermoplasmatota archaeon]
MKLEPLPEKKLELTKHASKKAKTHKDNTFKTGYKTGVDNSFEAFSQLIQMYKRYKDDVKLLMNEQKPLWKSWVSFYEDQNNIAQSEYLSIYNKWLFDYIFQEAREERAQSILQL